MGESETSPRKLGLVTFLVLIISFNLTLTLSFSENPRVDEESWWLNWSRDVNRNEIEDVLEDEIRKVDRVNVFVDYAAPVTEDDSKNLSQLNLTISYVTKYVNAVSLLNVTSSLVPVLTALPNVVMVELQRQIQPSLDVSVRAIKARASELYSPNTTWDLGYSGKDIVVAVLDTGVDDEHEFLRGKFVAGFDCSSLSAENDRETNPDDTDGHGTHVASIIMGTGGASGIYIGVAPGARLVDVKVLRSVGTNFENQLIRGIEWAIANKDRYRIRIINLSVSSTVEDRDGTSAISRAANRAVDEGLVVVVAAGNEGPNAETIYAPAVADKVIAVAAVDDGNTVDRDDDVIADYSSRGPRKDGAQKPDIAAPGSDIVGAQAAQRGTASDGLVRMWGTSMAAPHVAGVCALLLEANASLSPLDAKKILMDTAEDKGPNGWDTSYGWGEVDAYKAVMIASNGNFTGGHTSGPTLLPQWRMPPIVKVAEVLFTEFIITGYHLMMPWGFVLVVSVTVVVLAHLIVVRKRR